MKMWEVQSFYGTDRKEFDREYEAKSYAKKLESKMLERGQDKGLVEITEFDDEV